MQRTNAKLAILKITFGGIRGITRLQSFRTFRYKLCIQITTFEIVIKYRYMKLLSLIKYGNE